MNFNTHYELQGRHATMSASQYRWINYDPEKMQTVWLNNKKKEEGTRLHAFASEAIQLKVKAAPLKKAINQFINDVIGFNMESEVVLCYSLNAFGTADAISFKDNILRIFDLKTGTSRASFSQLDVYAALFCLEYRKKPEKIEIVQRIYQGNGFTERLADPMEITRIMQQIKDFDKLIMELESNI